MLALACGGARWLGPVGVLVAIACAGQSGNPARRSTGEPAARGERRVAFQAPSGAERELHRLINQYRAEHRLPPIPLSRSLTHVAQLHVRDLHENPPAVPCNMHSWSSRGPWTPCCYTPDHAQARCMWLKPAELTNYRGFGYENSHRVAPGFQTTPQQALASWQGSSPHRAVILNQGSWQRRPWRALGVGLFESYAVIWFGEEADPDGDWRP